MSTRAATHSVTLVQRRRALLAARTDGLMRCATRPLPQVRAERALWNSGNQILDQARTKD